MVRVVYAGVGVALALVAAVAADASSGGLSLELHRLPTAVVRRNAASQRQRRLKTEGDGFETVPLHLGMGTHYTWVYAGSPPQRASVITDTGSSIMAFPCAGCNNCGNHTDPPFDARNSSTLTHVTCDNPSFFRCTGCGGADSSTKTCEISQSYMEGSSWHATVVQDIVYLGGDNSFHDTKLRDAYGTHFNFGCQTSETGLFITQVADGIMGLANNNNHIVAKLFNEKKIPNKLFSLCFAQEGGAMSIGAPDTTRHKGNISYAKLIHTASHDFYGVELRDVRIAGTRVEAPPTAYQFGQYIVDSGTTDSYLPSSMKQAFQDAFKKASGLDYQVSSSACQGYTDEQLDKLPNIEYILGAADGSNLTVIVTPDQYLLQEATGKYCSSIFLSEASGGVIGANIMTGHDVIFDQENNRVGFVQADCDYRRLPASDAPATNVSTSSAPPTTSSSSAPTTMSSPPAPSATQAASTTAPVPTETTTTAPSATAVTQPPSTTVPPQTSAPPATTEAPTPQPTQATTAPVTTTPVPTTSVTTTSTPTTEIPSMDAAAKNGTVNAANDGEDAHPVVLTIVGAVLAVAFILGAIMAGRRKRTKRARKYGRVKETDGEDHDDDDDDEDDEEELIVHTEGQRKKPTKSTDDLESDEDDEDDDEDPNVRHGGRVGDRDSNDDDDDDDDDDIFEKDVAHHDAHKHDARMLEQL